MSSFLISSTTVQEVCDNGGISNCLVKTALLNAATDRIFLTFIPRHEDTYEISDIPGEICLSKEIVANFLSESTNGGMRIAQCDFQEAIYNYFEAICNYDQYHAPPKIEYSSWRILKKIADYTGDRVVHIVRFPPIDTDGHYGFAIFGRSIPGYQYVRISNQ